MSVKNKIIEEALTKFIEEKSKLAVKSMFDESNVSTDLTTNVNNIADSLAKTMSSYAPDLVKIIDSLITIRLTNAKLTHTLAASNGAAVSGIITILE